MHDNTDDLLQELADLESGELNAPAADKTAKTPSVNHPQDVLLEATGQAQEAAELAQVATDRALSLGKEQKESIIEISEALGTWRQASRAAHKELLSSRKKTAAMLGITAVLSIATLGGGGWILWQIQKAAENAKADVLDLLQTQLAVFNQKTLLKLDELAAVIESLQAELNRPTPADHAKTVPPSSQTPHYQAPVTFGSSAPVTASAPTQHAQPESGHEDPPPSHATPPRTAHTDTPSAGAHHTADTGRHAPFADAQLDKRLSAIEKALSDMQLKLHTLLQRQHASQPPHGSSATHSSALAEVRKLIAAQSQQLKIIRAALWKLRQQTTRGGHVQTHGTADLNTIKRALDTLTHQIGKLQAQQQQMRAEIAALKQQTAKLAADRPYSYKAPPLNLE